MLLQITYRSLVTPKMHGEKGLERMLQRARARNAERRITGALYFDGESFLQVFEGPKESVQELYLSLLSDPRHRNVVLLDMRPVPIRQFRDWGMGLVSPSTRADQLWNSLTGAGSIGGARLSPVQVPRFLLTLMRDVPVA